MVSSPRISHHIVETSVQTTQIAPTILEMLDLDPNELQAVKLEGTKVLPDLGKSTDLSTLWVIWTRPVNPILH